MRTLLRASDSSNCGEFDDDAVRVIALQVATARIPVSQHPALAIVTVDHVPVQRRPVGMTVYQARIAVLAQGGVDARRRRVHDDFGFELLFCGIFAAQTGDDRFALSERLREELVLPLWAAHLGAEFEV